MSGSMESKVGVQETMLMDDVSNKQSKMEKTCEGGFQVEAAIFDDAGEIAQLENFINPAYRVGEEMIQERIKSGLVFKLIVDGEICGVLFSILGNEDEEKEFEYRRIHDFHRSGGSTCYWIHLIVHPKYVQLSSKFHRFAQDFLFNNGIRVIKALTHCYAFNATDTGGSTKDQIANYALVEQKTDKNLFFHSARGAKFCGVLPNYNSTDEKNDGYAVIMKYSATETGFKNGNRPVLGETSKDHVAIDKLELMKLVYKVLPSLETVAFDEHLAWFELGMDSFLLMQFHALIEKKLEQTLDVSFLFGLNCFAKLADYFMESETKTDSKSIIPEKLMSKIPLAIYGIGVRFPGKEGSTDIEKCEDLWDVFIESENDPINPKDYKRLTNRQRFDVRSFEGRLNAEQARYVPPSQRWILETVMSALADAPDNFLLETKRNIGVFIGVWENSAMLMNDDMSKLERSTNGISAFSNSIMANRVSYLLDLRGPSMVIDTACSSSLVALDCARSAILAGQCHAALVIGCNEVTDIRTQLLDQAGFLSPTLECYPFDSRANGYSRSEGCGAVLIGDSSLFATGVRANVCSSAVNQDGATVNMHAPNPDAQIDLITRAYKSAQIRPEQVFFVEAHGTGTKLGDPIEAFALSTALRPDGIKNGSSLWISTSKAKFGHMEGAAGILGLIKAVLALQKGCLPPNRRLEKLNNNIPFEKYNISPVSKEFIQFPDGKIYCGISSFGFGGTNSHVILSSADSPRVSIDQNDPIDWGKRSKNIPFQPYVNQARAVARMKLSDKSIVDFLSNHRLGYTSVVPATYFICTAGANIAKRKQDLVLSDISFHKMLPLTESSDDVQLFYEEEVSKLLFKGGNTTYCEMSIGENIEQRSNTTLEESICACNNKLLDNITSFYASLGNKYSGPFQNLLDAKCNDDGTIIIATVKAPSVRSSILRASAIFDVALHPVFALYDKDMRDQPIFVNSIEKVYLPMKGLDMVKGSHLICEIKIRGEEKWDVTLFDQSQKCIILQISGIEFGLFESANRQLLYHDQWLRVENCDENDSLDWIHVSENSCLGLHQKMQNILSKNTSENIRVTIQDPGQLGYLRTARLEYPNARIQSIVYSEGETIIPSFIPSDEEEIVIDKEGQLMCRRLTPLLVNSNEANKIVNISSKSVVLVTGGSGGLGRKLCAKLKQLGVGKIIVISRKKPFCQRNDHRMVYVECDISDSDSLKKCLQQHLNSITGVFHCAGALADATIPNLTENKFLEAFGAKVDGICTIQELRMPNLEFMILFSSVTSAFGSIAQANYSSANAILDAIAMDNQESYPLLSVQFGPCAGEGMATIGTQESRWSRLGFPLLDPDLALDTMLSLTKSDHPVVLLSHILPGNLPRGNRYVEKLTGFTKNSGRASGSCNGGTLPVVIELLEGFNITISADQPWREAGMDSLSMVEFRNVLIKSFPCVKMSETVLFDYTTPSKLAKWLEQSANPVEEESSVSKYKSQDTMNSNEDHAVIGVACRLPGNISSPEELFTFLEEGHDAISEIPLGRFDTLPVYDPKRGTMNKMYTKRGAFIAGLEHFDNGKFGISLEEAQGMDPQQRVALEVAWEALMDADMLKSDKRIGVYVGVMTNDWVSVQNKSAPNAYTASGHCISIIANRISYSLGLNGPSLSIDTACSSSLVAIDTACAAIAKGDCDAALVIGVNLILSPDMYIEECAARMLSEDGHCHTFSAKANGYARGEGCVALVITSSNSARDEKLWCYVKGTAVNQDGRSANLTSPNGLSQQDVVNRAIERANIAPESISYLETHGTGTSLGDPLEVGALSQVFKNCDHPIALGAVKSALGHGEGAAGVTSVLKAIMCLQNRFVPGNISLKTDQDINPKVRAVALPCMKLLQASQQHILDAEAYVGVSGFGFGGTNAHVVLQGAGNLDRASYGSTIPKFNTAGKIPNMPFPADKPDGQYIFEWVKQVDAPSEICISNIFEVCDVQDVVNVIKNFKIEDRVSLCFVTRETVLNVDSEEKIQTACVFGFVRSLRLERPNWNVSLVDVHRNKVLRKELSVFDLNGDLVVREEGGEEIFMTPLLKQFSAPVFPSHLKGVILDSSCILITGANGGVARTFIEYIRNNVGNCTIICVSRSSPSDKSWVDEKLVWVPCDVANEKNVAHLKESLTSSGIKVDTLIHLAGILEECEISNFNEHHFRKHTEVKLTGAINLHNIFPEVERFVCFSSTSSIFGMHSGAAYAASNSGLNAFAQYRQQLGKPVINIMWDMWNEAGMAAARHLTSSNRGLTNDLACQTLISLLAESNNILDLVVIKIDWELFKNGPSKNLVKPFLSEQASLDTSVSFKTSSSDNILYSDVNQVLTRLSNLIVNFVEIESFDAAVPWREMGLDSLSMVSFVNRVNEEFHIPDEISETSMFDYPTPLEFAEYVFELLQEWQLVRSQEVDTQEYVQPASNGYAVLSVALRFPGPSTNCSKVGFWNFLCSEGDAMVEIPDDRIHIPEDDDTVYVKTGGFLHPDLFYAETDRKRYHISKSEEDSMDPHQLIALQVASEALEEAIINKKDLGVVGVFVGAQNTEYGAAQQVAGKPVNAFTATGTSLSIIANRISYTFNLKGPSMTIDTACSSSFCALDAAIKAISVGDCESALVLGVDLMLSSHRFRITCGAKMLSPNGRCATFSDQADGYARGEGCGAIVITKDDTVCKSWALIRGIAINQDGRSANLTSPVGPAQESCIKSALKRANITVNDIDFLETHGTGTSLGDPQEVQAIANVFGSSNREVVLGAVKTRIGHLEAAAGIAGLIKAILSIHQRVIPRNLHCKVINPRIEKLLRRCRMRFPSEEIKLGNSKPTLFAGVSSFGKYIYCKEYFQISNSTLGFGGTNSHVVISSVDDHRKPVLEETKLITLPQVFSIHRQQNTLSNVLSWLVKMEPQCLNVVRNHRVGSLSVVPATTYIEILNPIIEELCTGATYSLDGLKLSTMLFIEPDSRELEFLVELADHNQFTIKNANGQVEYASMRLSLNTGPKCDIGNQTVLTKAKELCISEIDCGDQLYASVGNGYSGPFSQLTQAWCDKTGTTLLGKVELLSYIPTRAQPSVWLDVCSHVAISALDKDSRIKPIYAKGVESYYSASMESKMCASGSVWSLVDIVEPNVLNMRILNQAGDTLAFVERFSFGFFQASKQNATSLIFQDRWIQATESSNKTQRVEISVDTVEALHEHIIQFVKADKRPALLVKIRTPGQIGYMKCLSKEYPSWQLQWICSDNIEDLDIPIKHFVEQQLHIDSNHQISSPVLEKVSIVDAPKLLTIKKNGVYLITGGMGVLGLALADLLYSKGVSNVILLGRKEFSESPNGMEYIQCDLGDLHSVQAKLSGLKKVDGIFHTAGVLHDATIPNMELETFEFVRRPKLTGVRNLASVLQPSDFFVLYSSVACSFGSAGQANYAAANAELDNFAVEMNQLGGSTCKYLSIRWGPWDEGGMAHKSAARWNRLGLSAMNRLDALNAMFDLAIDVGSIVTICDVYNTIKVDDPYLRNIYVAVEDSTEEEQVVADFDKESILKKILDISTYVANAEIQIDTTWRDAGFDSLSMVEFKNILAQRVGNGLKLHDTILFDHPTPNMLADWLTQLLGKNFQAKPKTQVASPARYVAGSKVVSGLACRLPGNSNSPAAFWRNLCLGKDFMQEIPAMRFDTAGIYDSVHISNEKMYTNQGSFLEDIEYFDYAKFGISEQEALYMDPQQRLAIEVGYEALVDANALKSTKRVGVFVGVMTTDWLAISSKMGTSTAFSASGHANSIIANRISYVLGLNGPSMSIDTACSSSLVALDVANASLERGDCDMALVIGVNLILSPDLYLEECAARMLSPKGRCFTFSKLADGYARGEGCVALVLENEATYTGASKWGKVLASAVNQDGRSANLTSPNGSAQQDVILRAIQRANLDPDHVDYIETHGTGTALGDPLEIASLATVFESESRKNPLVLGAVKSCFGHGEGAAGLSGVLKGLLCLKYGIVPGNPSIDSAEDINPKIQDVVTNKMKIPSRKESVELRNNAICGISGFGFGGTNAHVIIQAPDQAENQVTDPIVISWSRKLVPWNPLQHSLPKSKNSISILHQTEDEKIPKHWTLYSDFENKNSSWILAIYKPYLDLLGNHRVGSVPLMPASLYMEAIGELLEQIDNNIYILENFELKSMLPLSQYTDNVYIRIWFDEVTQKIRITSLDSLTTYAEGLCSLSDARGFDESTTMVQEVDRICKIASSAGTELYETFGNRYKDNFASLKEVRRSQDGTLVYGKVIISNTLRGKITAISWLDCSFHVFLATLPAADRRKAAFARSIGRYESVSSSAKEICQEVSVICKIKTRGERFDLWIFDSGDRLITRIEDGILGLSDVQQQQQTQEYIKKQPCESTEVLDYENLIQEIGKRVSGKKLSRNTPWKDAGFDSLSMVEFRNQLQQELGSSFPIHDTILFDYPTPHQLSSWLNTLDSKIRTTQSTSSKVDSREAPRQQVSKITTSDISITGVSCRLPGNANTPEAFWEILNGDEDTFSRIPRGRFDVDAYYDQDMNNVGKMYTDSGAFISKVDYFDNERYGISDNEANAMDPQQRLAITVVNEALQNAAIDTDQVGVYVGCMTNDWVDIVRATRSRPSSFSAAGHSTSIIANRVSYVLGLHGPSMTLNTACSSSLVAIDAACAAIQRGDCEAAVVVGVNLILSPDVYIEECASRMLSPNGKCFTFSSLADGYARGEACVAIVIQPTELVVNRGLIWGKVAATSVNQDGRSANLTSPNGVSQRQVITRAIERANIRPDQVSYVESHGTGTDLGDSIEIAALSSVFPDQKLIVGSVKPCVGHTEGAAGVTSILKALLCLKYRCVPKNMNMPDISPKVSKVMTSGMILPKESIPLSKTSYVGVSGFGFGGTNAHIILQGVEIGDDVYESSATLQTPSFHVEYDSDDDENGLSKLCVRDQNQTVTENRFPWKTSKTSDIHFGVDWVQIDAQRLTLQRKNVFKVKSVFEVMNIINQLDLSRSLSITFVTTQCMMDILSVRDVEGAAVWGFVRSLRYERNKWKINLVDIKSNFDISNGILMSPDENEYIIRSGILIPRLKVIENMMPTALKFCLPVKSDSYIIVSGASGGIAQSVVEFLRKQVGHRRFVLLGRSFSNSTWKSESVVKLKCNVSDADDVKNVAHELAVNNVSIDGILHCAGMLEESPISVFDPVKFQQHYDVKVNGAINLDKWFPQVNLFVTFSSTSSLFGMACGSNYAASNSALDAFTVYRNEQLRRKTFNIQWDIWRETGMAHDRNVMLGNRGLSTQEACQGMCGIISSSLLLSPVVIIRADLSSLNQSLHSNLLKDVADIPVVKVANSPQITQIVASGNPSSEKLRNLLFQCGIHSMTESFQDLGMDSLKSIEIVNSIADEFQVTLQPTFYMDYVNGESLAAFISNPTEKETESGAITTEANPWLDLILSPDIRLYCFAYAGGHPSIFNAWLPYLPATVQLCPITMPGYGKQNTESRWSNIISLAQDIGKSLPTDKPFMFVGACLGAIIAYEVSLVLDTNPSHFFSFTCAAPSDYAEAIKFTFDGVLSDSPFLKSAKKGKPEAFSKLSECDRLAVIKQLREASFFKDDETLRRLETNKQYFDQVLGQLANQLQLAESYAFENSRSLLRYPITAIGGQRDDTIPIGWCNRWMKMTSSTSEYVEVADAGHFLIQTHVKEACNIINNIIDKSR